MAPSNIDTEVIVVAEDSDPNRKILVHLLTRLGYEVYACEDGEQAWESMEALKNKKLAAVVSDIMMPVMDGIQLLQKIRSSDEYKDLPVLLVTAVSDKSYIMEASRLHVNGYILKPLTFQRVIEKMQELFPNKTFPQLAG